MLKRASRLPVLQTLDCTECHVKPEHYTDAGHIFRTDGSIDPRPAEVRFGPMARWSLAGVLRGAM